VNYLRGFAPWLLFSLLSATDWRWAALLALLLVAVLFVLDRRAGKRIDAQVLEIGTLAYFAGITALAVAVPDSPVRTYVMALSSAWLALIALTSLLIRRPFTLGLAGRRVPPHVARTARFRQVNMVITGIWATGFVLSAATSSACAAIDAGPAAQALCHGLSIGLAGLATHLYSARSKARLATASQPERV